MAGPHTHASWSNSAIAKHLCLLALILGTCLSVLGNTAHGQARAEIGATVRLPSSHMDEHWLDSVVDGEDAGISVLMIRDMQGLRYVRIRDLDLLNLPVPDAPRYRYRGEIFVPVTAFARHAFRPDLDRRILTIASDAAEPASSSTADPDIVAEHWLQVVVRNVRKWLSALVLEDSRGNWYVRHKDLLTLGMAPSTRPPVRYRGERFHAFETLAPRVLIADPGWQLLHIDPPLTPRTPGDVDALEAGWVEVRVNEMEDRRVVLALEAPDNRVYLGEDVIGHYRLRPGEGDPVRQHGEVFYPVAGLRSVRAAIDRRKQALALYAPAESFLDTTSRAKYGRLVDPDLDTGGGFVNYSLFGSSGERSERVDGQFELGAFAGRGLFTTTQLQRGLTGDMSESVRMESSLRLDWPQSMKTLRLGDTIDFPGAWGRAVRFGGIRWGTNFATQPGFITFPMPAVRGETEVPATVDVFVNNARRSSHEVPPGAFSIREVPVVTGSGDMRVVVRDVFGREQVITTPFYANNRLLRDGLHEYSYELGKVREDFGLASNQYGRAFFAGTHRYGLTDHLTGELRAEVLADQATLGLAGDLLLPALGEFHLAFAASQDTTVGQYGQLAEVGFRRQTRRLSFGADVRATTAGFVQLGQRPGELPDALRTRAFAGLGMGGIGSLAVSHIHRQRRGRQDAEFATFQYSVSLGGIGHVVLSMLQPLSDDLERSANLMLSIPLAGRGAMQVGGSQRSEGTTGRVQVQRNLPSGPGFGYRASTETGAVPRRELGVALRGDAGSLGLQTAETDGRREHRASLDGGIAFMDWRPRLSRRIDDGFALVEVPGQAGVDVYRDNRPVATTDDSGFALVPNLRPYQDNPIRIGDAGLPMDIAVGSLQAQTIPGFRRGVRVRFDVERSHWVGFSIDTGAAGPVPAGTRLQDEATGRSFPVGFDGKAHVEGKPGLHTYQVRWDDHQCEIVVAIPETTEVMPNLGSKTCR